MSERNGGVKKPQDDRKGGPEPKSTIKSIIEEKKSRFKSLRRPPPNSRISPYPRTSTPRDVSVYDFVDETPMESLPGIGLRGFHSSSGSTMSMASYRASTFAARRTAQNPSVGTTQIANTLGPMMSTDQSNRDVNAVFPDNTSIDINFPKTTSMDNDYPNTSGVEESFPSTSGVNMNFRNTSSVEVNFSDTAVMNVHFPNTSSGVDVDYPNTSGVDVGYPNTSGVDDGFPNTSGVDMNYPNTSSVDANYPNTSGLDINYPNTSGVDVDYPITSSVDVNFSDTGVMNVHFPNTGSGVDVNYPNTSGVDVNYPNISSVEDGYPNMRGVGVNYPSASGMIMFPNERNIEESFADMDINCMSSTSDLDLSYRQDLDAAADVLAPVMRDIEQTDIAEDFDIGLILEEVARNDEKLDLTVSTAVLTQGITQEFHDDNEGPSQNVASDASSVPSSNAEN